MHNKSSHKQPKGKKTKKASEHSCQEEKTRCLSLKEEKEENVSKNSGGSRSEKEDTAAEQDEGTGSEDLSKKKEGEL